MARFGAIVASPTHVLGRGTSPAAHFRTEAAAVPLALDPVSSGAMQVMADCLFNLKRFTEAADWHRKVAAYYPDRRSGTH